MTGIGAMRLRISRTRFLRLSIGTERVILRGHSSSPTATKDAVVLGVREAFDALSARVEASGGRVGCVLLSGVTHTGEESSGAFTMGEGFTDADDVFRFALLTTTALGEAVGVPVHVGLVERPIGRDE